MPAVIDTGGPRVLHCVERAVCPIILSASTITSSSSSSSSSSPSSSSSVPLLAQPSSYPVRQQQQSRLSVDAVVHRCNESRLADTLHRSSIIETRFIPGNDERDEFFPDERSPSVSTTSSNDLGRLIARSDCARDRKRYDALRRRRISRRNRQFNKINRAEESVASARDNKHVPEPNETVRECERLSSSNCHVESDEEAKLWQRTSTSRLEKDPHGSSTTSSCHLNRILYVNNPHGDGRPEEDDGQSSDIFMRLFGGFCVKQRELMYPRIEKRCEQSAAISSQRLSNCLEYEGPYQCECFSRLSRDEFGSTKVASESERTARERRKSRHRSHILHKGRSYVQLALLLFLVAFGHGSFFKSNFGTFSGKSSSVGAGLGVFTIGTIVGCVRALPIDLDAGIRAERSANLSHITGVSRKIQMYIKNRHLQILPDGTVNGSNDDTSEYTIFQRTSVSRGQLKIQGVVTCLYLCMDSCGLLYGSRESTEDCVFNETLEQHNYNTYSSIRWSTPKKSLYLGLNRHGQPRRVQAKGHNLGRLSAYARVLTRVVSPERLEALQARMLGAHHNVRHHHNSHRHRNIQNQQQHQQQQTVCQNLPPQEKDGRDKFRCRKRKKRKKRKRKCNEGEKPGGHCEFVEVASHGGNAGKLTSTSETPESKKSCEGDEMSEESCRKQTLDPPAKKKKLRIEGARVKVETREKQQQKQPQRKKEMRGRKGGLSERQADEEGKSFVGRITDEVENSKRKRPANKQRVTSTGMKKKINGRVSRTTVTNNSTILAMTLPSSWFPGASTTPPTDISGWRRNGTIGVENSLTSLSPKATRIGKSLDEAQLLAPESSTVETNTEGNFYEHSSLSYFTNDSSLETSDEIKFDDESSQQDDESTNSNIEYSTLMTTMDTTPPERTEDYTRATTQSIPPSIVIDRNHQDDVIDDSTRLEKIIKFGRETRPSLERLAM